MLGAFSGLRSRLGAVLIIAIVPAIVFLTIERISHSRAENAEFRETALALARLAAQAQQRRIEGARQLLIALSRSSELQNPATCTRFVRGLTAEYDGIYTEIGWADLSGRVVCHALEGPADISIADRMYFQRALRTRSFVTGDFMRGRISGTPALAFAHPIWNGSNAISGVAFVNMDLRVLSESLKADVLGSDATVSLLDRHGTLLARSADATKYIGVRASADQLRSMHEGGEFATEYSEPDAIIRVFGLVTIRDSMGNATFFVAVGRPRAPLVTAAQRRLVFDLIAVALLGAGLLAGCWVGSDYLIRRPLKRVLDTTAAIASGRLDARVNDGGGIRELQTLGTALNEMAEKLQQRDLHLRRGQRLEAVGQLAGGVAHDFNNLLTVILGYSESLRDRVGTGTVAAEELSELRAAAERAAKLTQQLLAFSRQQVLQPKPVNVNEVIAHMQSLVTRTIGDDIVLVTVNMPNLGIVRADPAQLEQVVLNLVINARDAMPDGGTITIETTNVDLTAEDMPPHAESVGMTTGAYVALSVTDTGIGMDEETRGRLFEPFFTTKGQAGTGLGLATVYGIVKQSGGFIFCDSNPGRGTRFTIYLPSTNEKLAVVQPERPMLPRGGSETVLVVEDQTAVRSYIERVLTRAGYRVSVAPDGREAARWIDSGGAVDLLLTDVKMPGMNGRTLYEHARAQRSHLAVLFISGYARDVLDIEPTLSDLTSFLPKPFTPADLLSKVRQMLDEARTLDVQARRSSAVAREAQSRHRASELELST
jgi:signal transduction histidine kinase/CheY-like chemotaxis protein